MLNVQFDMSRIIEVQGGTGRTELVSNRPFKSSTWSLTSGIPATTRALDFSMSTRALVRKTAKVSQAGFGRAYGNSVIPAKIEVFMSNSPSSPTHWLSQIRLNVADAEATASTFHSLEVDKTFELMQKCDYQTCNGCIDLNVQRLCYAAQQCTLAKCIGTLTNQNRPLCGIGKTGEAMFTTQVVMIEASWRMFVEGVTTIIDLSLSSSTDSNDDGFQVKWIDDGFYSSICTAKDATAAFISVLTSTINIIVQYVGEQQPVTYMEMNAQKVDSNFQAMFTMIVTSMNNLLNQIAIGIFYVYMAMQKIIVCETNSIVALISNTGFEIYIGIPEIQKKSDQAMGKCLTTFYSESLNTPPEGGNLEAFALLTGDISKQLAGTAVSVYLEQFKHPIDAAFTWMIGVLTGVQDVIQTIDMAHCKLPDFFMKVRACVCLCTYAYLYRLPITHTQKKNRTSSSAPALIPPTRSHWRGR
jgi:hypothetical protein